MEAELVDGARHVAAWVKFYPEFCCLCPILLQLLPVDRVVRVDDAEKDMKTVNETDIHTTDLGQESFVLEGFSCSISSVGITKASCSNLVDYETQLVCMTQSSSSASLQSLPRWSSTFGYPVCRKDG